MKIPLGLWEGSTENATVATAPLLADLVDRGLDVQQGVLVVLDGGKGAAEGRQGRPRRGAGPSLRAA